MPPYTEVMGLDSNQESFSSSSAFSSVVASGRQKIFPERMQSLQKLELCETDTQVAKDRCIKEFTIALQNLKEHVEHLLESQSHHAGESHASPANDACLYSLRHKMPRFLQRASLLVERLKSQDTNSELMVAKLRCSFGMAAAVQFLDTIEYGLTCPARDIIDERLSLLLEEVAKLTQHDPYFTFRVSHSAAPSLRLAFDLPASLPVTTTAMNNNFPISVTVEPYITYPAEDLYNVYKELNKPRVCAVEIIECKHSPLEFAEGAGIVGTAFVKVRLTPMHGHGHANSMDVDDEEEEDLAWGSQRDLDKIVIKEARVIQQNSYPPKPRTAVDLYTSEGFGDPGITLTLVIKTCDTEHGEAPKLTIALSLATAPSSE